MKKCFYVPLVMLLSVIGMSCDGGLNADKDREAGEALRKIGDSIEKKKKVVEKTKNQTKVIKDAQAVIEESQENIKKREQQVPVDIDTAIKAAGEKLPTKCQRCNWTSSMAKESFNMLVKKYGYSEDRRACISAAYGTGGIFLSSCPYCSKNWQDKLDENTIKEKEKEMDNLKAELLKMVSDSVLQGNDEQDLVAMEKASEVIQQQIENEKKLSEEVQIAERKRKEVEKEAAEAKVREAKSKAEKDKAEAAKLEAQKKAEEEAKRAEDKERENLRLKEEKEREAAAKLEAQKKAEEEAKRAEEQERENLRLKEEKIRQEEEIERIKKEAEEKEKQFKFNTAKEMIKNKLNINLIISITGLSKEEIEEIELTTNWDMLG